MCPTSLHGACSHKYAGRRDIVGLLWVPCAHPPAQLFPEKQFAFIQFETHAAALAAKKSERSVCGNRFIRVQWARHDPDDPEDADLDDKVSTAPRLPLRN